MLVGYFVSHNTSPVAEGVVEPQRPELSVEDQGYIRRFRPDRTEGSLKSIDFACLLVLSIPFLKVSMCRCLVVFFCTYGHIILCTAAILRGGCILVIGDLGSRGFLPIENSFIGK